MEIACRNHHQCVVLVVAVFGCVVLAETAALNGWTSAGETLSSQKKKPGDAKVTTRRVRRTAVQEHLQRVAAMRRAVEANQISQEKQHEAKSIEEKEAKEILPRGHTAEDRVYPVLDAAKNLPLHVNRGGRMTAQDVHKLFSEIGPMHILAAKAHKLDTEQAGQKVAAEKRLQGYLKKVVARNKKRDANIASLTQNTSVEWKGCKHKLKQCQDARDKARRDAARKSKVAADKEVSDMKARVTMNASRKKYIAGANEAAKKAAVARQAAKDEAALERREKAVAKKAAAAAATAKKAAVSKQAASRANINSMNKAAITTLGESRITKHFVKAAQAIKTTAVDDDMRRRGEKPVAAREQAQPAWHQFKRTAKQRMEDEEKRRPLLPVSGGVVVKQFPKATLAEIARTIHRIQQTEKAENRNANKDIVAATKHAQEAVVAQEHAEKLLSSVIPKPIKKKNHRPKSGAKKSKSARVNIAAAGKEATQKDKQKKSESRKAAKVRELKSIGRSPKILEAYVASATGLFQCMQDLSKCSSGSKDYTGVRMKYPKEVSHQLLGKYPLPGMNIRDQSPPCPGKHCHY